MFPDEAISLLKVLLASVLTLKLAVTKIETCESEPHAGFTLQAIAFGLYIMPLNFMWEKLLGIHEGHYLLRVVARVPIACVLWFLALLVPFFGPLNSLIGAFIMSFSVYIIPCVAYLMVFKHPQSRKVRIISMLKVKCLCLSQ